MFCQISSFMGSYLSKQLYRFRKGYSRQYCLFVMLEKRENSEEKGKYFETDRFTIRLSFPQTVDSEITRLWLRLAGPKTYQSYLSNRKQRNKFNATYSSWEEIFFGFNIFLCDLLWIMCETDSLLYFFTRVIYSNVAAQKLYGRVVVLEIPTKLTCASSFCNNGGCKTRISS